ncbi:protein singed [Vreelandella aquamarina]|uniref:Protein singed n=1 Tax=Vreelandella aquamarina TaxID=77097 RepID=A0A857GLC6_9GAMM|nr:protein singed [Halomonas meridiana]QHD50052.1 protein singed [Halomonas meridiana]
MQYVTVADVDEKLGDAWAPEADKTRFVAMANAYLSAQRIQIPDPVPEEIKLAGAELAAAAADGSLYVTQTQGALTQKRVKADTVESEKRYADVSATFGKNAALPERVQFALALIEQYRIIPMGITVGYGNHELT